MEQRVLAFCREKRLFCKGEKVVIGLSGGVDSVALTHFLVNSDFSLQITLAHVNYGLRGNDSDLDEEFVKNLAASYRLPCIVERVRPEFWKDNKGLSKQEAARNFRYQFFFTLAGQTGSSAIAVGHHRDDQAETVLGRILRGSGLHGLAGMLPRRPDGVTRPFLCVSKEEIIGYAQRHKLEWREDYTNRKDIYTRNKVRLELLPMLQKYNTNIKEQLAFLADDAQKAAEFWRAGAIRWLEQNMKSDGDNWKWSRKAYLEIPEFLQSEILRTHFLKEMGSFPSRDLTGFIMKFLQEAKDGDHFTLPRGWVIQREADHFRWGRAREKIVLSKVSIPLTGVIDREELPWRIITLILARAQVNQEDWQRAPSNLAYFDLEKIDKEKGIGLRPLLPGDRFCPLGMGGSHKKIQDLLVDRKFSPAAKARTFVLENGDEIMWVAGCLSSEIFKITAQTEKILLVRLEENI